MTYPLTSPVFYPLLAIGTSDATGFTYALVSSPVPARNTPIHTTSPVDKWDLQLYPEDFPVGNTTLTIAVTNHNVPSLPVATYSVVVTRHPDYTLTTPVIFNEDMAIMVDSSNPANLLAPKSFKLSSNYPTPPTYTIDYVNTTLIGATVDVLGVVNFTPTQYGDFYLTVNARISDPDPNTATKTFKVSIIPSHLYKLVDGQIEFDFTGSDASVGTHLLNFGVVDSTLTAQTKAAVVNVKPSLTGIQVVNSHLKYWITTDTPSDVDEPTVLPLTGSLANTVPIMNGAGSFDNGLNYNVTGNSITLTPPGLVTDYSARSAEQVIPIALTNNYGSISTTVRTMVIKTNNLGLIPTPSNPAPFSVDIYLNTFRIAQEFFALNPLKPYVNSPEITIEAGFKARLKSGQVLPAGLSLDSVTGLVYGVPQGAWTPAIPVTVEFVDSNNILIGSVDIHFDIVECYLTLNDQMEAPVTSRVLTAGTTTVNPATNKDGALTFSGNSIIRYDRSWTEEGVKPIAASLLPGAIPTTITLSGFLASGNNRTVQVASVTSTNFPGDTLTITNGTFTSATAAYGTAIVQTFLRSAVVNANTLTAVSVYKGHLPSGLEAQVSGKRVLLTGIPSEFGIFDLTLMVTDNQGNNSHWILSRDRGTALEIPFSVPLQILTTSSQLPVFNSTDSFSFQLQARGGAGNGNGPYAWSLASGSTLPPNISLSSTGVLSGSSIPAFSATSVSFIVTDSNGLGETTTLTLSYDNTLRITTTVIPNFIVGSTVRTYVLKASGGSGIRPVNAWTSTALPLHISLDSATGILTYDGSSTEVPATSVTFFLNDGSNTTSKTLNVQALTSQGNFNFIPALGSIQRGRPYAGYVRVTGGVVTPSVGYSWDVQGLPVGLSATWSDSVPGSGAHDQLNITGITNTSATSISISITAIDSTSASKDYNPTIAVGPGLFITTSVLPQIRPGRSYLYYGDPNQIDVYGNDLGLPVQIMVNAPGSYTVSSPDLTSSFPGLSITPSGVISGTYVGATHSASVTFTATNTAYGGNDTVSVTIPMTAITSSLKINPIIFNNEPLGQAWIETLTATNGVGALTWAPTSVLPTTYPLPPGISFGNAAPILPPYNGQLGGNTLTSGRYPLSFQVTDSTGAVANWGSFLTIGAAQTIKTGPDYTNGLTLGYVGYICAATPGSVLTVNPAPSKSFRFFMTRTASTNINTMSVSVFGDSTNSITASIDSIDNTDPNNRIATISLHNLPVTPLGDSPSGLGLNIVDNGSIISVPIKYKAIAKRSVTVTQANSSLLPVENV